MYVFQAIAALLIWHSPYGTAADGAVDIKTIVAINPTHVPGEPVTVAATRFAKSEREKPDLLIDIRNNSDRKIAYVRYALSWPDCPRQAVKPGAIIVSYGSVDAIASPRVKDEGPIESGGIAVLRIPGKIFDRTERWKRKYGCVPTMRPEFVLMKVAFTDGTGWEGFSDRLKRGQWSGRPWTPP